MKRTINLFLFALLIIAFSCTKQETKAYYIGGTNPVLTGTANSGSSAINLKAADSTLTGLTLAWTNPNYMFNYGVSSLDASYLIEMDTTGSNFTNPKRAQIGISQSTAITLTEATINSYLANQMGLDTSFSHKLDVRVAASMANSGTGAKTLYSNVLNYTAKPFYPPPIVAPPASGNLWILGDAVASGWSNPLPAPYDVSQKFTKVTATKYTLVVNFNATGGYKLIQVQGDWGTQFHALAPALAATGKFEQKDSDPQFPSPGAGTYLITIDFQTGTYTVVKQ
jgi:starch-binding outer membrane protein SusE/F